MGITSLGRWRWWQSPGFGWFWLGEGKKAWGNVMAMITTEILVVVVLRRSPEDPGLGILAADQDAGYLEHGGWLPLPGQLVGMMVSGAFSPFDRAILHYKCSTNEARPIVGGLL
jgi:hypothetical protein